MIVGDDMMENPKIPTKDIQFFWLHPTIKLEN